MSLYVTIVYIQYIYAYNVTVCNNCLHTIYNKKIKNNIYTMYYVLWIMYYVLCTMYYVLCAYVLKK